MTQSALTVTTPSPSPPTNMSFTGATPPNVPNLTKLTYLNYVGVGLLNASGNNGAPPAPLGLWSAVVNPPPFFDDAVGGIGTGTTFAASTAALASGTGVTSGGTEGSYPVQGGAVPASTSVTAEGAGTETSFVKVAGASTDYGLDLTKYGPNIYAPIPLVTLGAGPALVKATTDAGAPVSPNKTHPSSLSPATNPALTSIASIASGGGNGTCTATGTNFTPQSVLNVNGINYPTTFTSSTTISCTAPKKATAGTLPVYVTTGGVVVTATVNWTFT